MANFNEAIQISIVSVGIVFASLAVFNLLIHFMGRFFTRSVTEKPVPCAGPVVHEATELEKAQIAAMMAAFREEFGDRIVEMKITRKD